MIAPEDYKAVMRNLGAGVTIVTTELDGRFHGMTASSFTSVSLDPPLVQVTLDKESRTHGAVEQSGKFGASILAADQEAIARRYADPDDPHRFDDLPVKIGETGVPLLVGSIGMLECRVTQIVPGGDHTVFIGEVLHTFAEEGPPLIYFQGSYQRLADLEEESQ